MIEEGFLDQYLTYDKIKHYLSLCTSILLRSYRLFIHIVTFWRQGRPTIELNMKRMKKLILITILSLCLPMMSNASGGGPNKTNAIEWLSKNLSYPENAIENNEEGIVYVAFTISPEGRAENIEIEEGCSKALNQEATRVIESTPLLEMYSADNPQKTYILPIKFTLK